VTVISAKVVVDQGASWAGPTVAIIASVVFVVFAMWIVIQRVRHGRGGDDD
jgi:hypothetical protein